MSFLYKYRGWFLGVLALVMLLVPGAPVSDEWLVEALPLSVACFVAFVILRIQARRIIGEHTRGFTHDADRLVTEGVYSRIRHPLYLSNAGIGYAFIILHFGIDLLALPFVVLLLAFEFILSRMEDAYLESRFGDEWRNWAKVTPAFFPNLTGRAPAFCGHSAPKLATGERSASDDKLARRSVFASFWADASTWIWLFVAIALIMGRKFVG